MKFSNFMNSRDESFWSFFQSKKRRESTTATTTTDDVLATTTTETAARSHGNICVICRHVFPTATCCSNSNSTSSYSNSSSSSRQQQQSRSKRRSISRSSDCDCNSDCNCDCAANPTTTTFPRTQEHVAEHAAPTCCQCLRAMRDNNNSSSGSSNSCCCNSSSSSSSRSCRWCSSYSTNDNNQKLTTTTTANCNWSNNEQQQQQKEKHKLDFILPTLHTLITAYNKCGNNLQQQHQQQQTRRHRKHYQHYGRTHSAATATAFASASASAFTILALLAMHATATFAWQTTQPPWPASASALHTPQEDQLLIEDQQQQQQQQWEQQQDYEESQRFANSLDAMIRRTRSASNNAISRGSDVYSGSDRRINASSGEARLANKVTPCKSIDIRNSILESKKLENCTIIEGFLLLTLISDASILNRTFPLLTEITGYLMVYRVQNLVSLSLMFPNLSVIRGNILFEGYALVIYQNHHLSDVGLYNLHAITKGGVRIEKNSFLCFYNTINWMKILSPNATSAEIKLQHNRDEKQCAKCPGDSSQEVGGDGSNRNKVAVCQQYNGKRYCWNSERCQKFCPKECPYSCINETTCCNKACLGGCAGGDKKGLNQCVACRNISNRDDICIDSCNKEEYLYEQRCLTAAACHQLEKKYENGEEKQLVTHNGKCTTRCDKGYALNNGTCEKCIGRCIKKCEGDTVESVERSKKFQGCTHIVEKGLHITIKRGGPHVTQALIAAFGMLETIETYLQVYSTYGIVSLSFFKNLKRIKGDVKIDGRYSLYVLENRDLETIWGENQTVQIESGSVFFHFNQKLCYENIEKLQPMLPGKPTKFNKNEVSEDSNGDKGTCNTRWMQVNRLKKFSTFLMFEVNNTIVEFNDDRSFIGFLIYHALDPYENVTRDYEQSCSDVWKVSDPVMPDSGNTTHLQIAGLTPFTKYAFYVRTLTISSEKRNYQSDIQRFQTLPQQPMPVAKSMANSSVSSQILMRWSPSSAVNGILEKYQIRAVLSSRDPLLESNRNYCVYPLPRPSDKDEAEQKIAKEIEKAGCKCEGGQNTFSQSDVDRTLADDIEFENALQNFLYVAKRKKPVEITNSTVDSAGDNAVQRSRSKRYIEINEDEPMESVLMRTVRSTNESTPNIKTQNATDEHLNWLKEIRMDPTHTYYTVFSAEVPANTTEYLFTNLRHFSLYTLSVHVCRKRMENDSDIAVLCSTFESWDKRTFMKDGVDKVEAPVGRLEKIQNSTRDSVRLTWDPPANPNGAAVSYSILYGRVDKEDIADVERKCITAQEYLNQSGYVFTNLKEGRYRFTVQVGTLAGDGEFSEETFVTVPPPSKTWAEIAVWIVVPLIVLIALSLIIYFYIKSTKKHPQDLVMNTEVNPFYASLQYVPDDWEVPRERIIQLGPLGQGSFGMVYEGILKAQNSQDEDTPCAIKTVNENATDRERTNFLSEASVMKQFDTYHVVHLLGVCSCGQPALVVMELMKKGDLKSYLRAHRPDEREALSAFQQRIGLTSNPQPPPYSRIYQMAIEIADGMAYLAYKKFVHRDLAARNCMVAEDLTVKIGDFGMTRDIYETDYYRKGTKGLLPVRWMPPESLRDGVYASSSDVFSYGVVLWEMATLASQPYQGLSNEQVLRFVIDGGIMERPDNCPEAMHALMHRCWHHRPSARPTFLEIIAYLEHLAEPKFKEVAFYYSDAGVQHREKERKENSNQMEIQLDPDPHMVDGGEDATTPLRVGEYQGEFKSNMQHNTSMDQPAESPIALVDDQATTHSPFSMHSGFIVSSTPDALSTMPTAGGSHMEDAAYVMPDGHGHSVGTHPEQGYEIYDPSPNFVGHLSGEQHLLPKKKRGAGNVVGNMSSSMPDEMIDGSGAVAVPHVGGSGGGASSSLQPSTGSPSNASNSRLPISKKRGVADTLRNRISYGMLPYGLLSRFNHKRSGSNVSHKSNVSNAPSSSSNSNLTSHPVGMAMTSMGTNLGTIESGGSGSAGSYAGTPHFYTPTATTPSAGGGGGGGGGSVGGGNGSTTIVSDNPNYKLLDESINSAAGDPVGNSSAWPQQLTTSSLNPNYELMQPPPAGEKDAHTRLLSSDNPNYVLMNDPNPPSEPTGHIFTTDNPNYAAMMAPIAVRNSSDDDNNDDDDDDDDADEHTEHIKMERMPLSRQKPRARIKPMQHQQQQQPRSRSVSQTRKTAAAAETPTPTPTATATAAVVVGGTGGNTSNLLKENWLRQASTPRPPPPNGFIGREA